MSEKKLPTNEEMIKKLNESRFGEHPIQKDWITSLENLYSLFPGSDPVQLRLIIMQLEGVQPVGDGTEDKILIPAKYVE